MTFTKNAREIAEIALSVFELIIRCIVAKEKIEVRKPTAPIITAMEIGLTPKIIVNGLKNKA